MVDRLKLVELRLLRCTLLSPQHRPPNPNLTLDPLVESLLASIERGDYSAALASPAAKLVFPFADSFRFDDSVESAEKFYGEVERGVEVFLRTGKGCGASEAWLDVLDSEGGGDDGGEAVDVELRFAIVMSLGVAALLAFMQQNVTGPVGRFSPFPVSLPHLKKDEVFNGGGMWDKWAQDQLTSVGCCLLGKFMHLQYIVYGNILLSKAKDLSLERTFCLSGARSISWWLCRLILLQQRTLDELSSSLYDLLQVCKKETLNQFGELDYVVNYWGSQLCEGEAVTVVSIAQLEAGILEHKYNRDDTSRLHVECAEAACGMHHSVTGVSGYRTKNQVDPTPQRVLVPNTNSQSNGAGQPAERQATDNSDALGYKMNSLPYDCSDVLIKPRLVESVSGRNEDMSATGNDIKLTATQQVVVLAHCLHLQRRGRSDELSKWDMAPYIEAIDGQYESSYAIRCFSNLLRIRWESTRNRTKERALLMMDKLVQTTKEDFPMVVQRIQVSFAVYLPTIPAMRKEYGELLVSCGMVGEALKIFEDLELWDNLIFCYRLLDKKAAAVDLIKARLVDMPGDPRLWCSLGDVTNTDAYFEKALEVSKNRSARAMRSLARSAYNRGDYRTSKSFWESAMAINSLFPDGWFALGAAALKAQDYDKALDAFTHAVQLDPENGEAWNNIAFLHMRNKKSRPAFIAFKEALKFRRNTWQLWENYSQVAMELGNYTQVLEAMKQVLDLTNNKRVNAELLDKVMRVVEDNMEFTDSAPHDAEIPDVAPQAEPSCSMTNTSETSSVFSEGLDMKVYFNEPMNGDSDESEHKEPALLTPREGELLTDMLGSILAQVVKNSVGAETWGLYARWHKIKGNLTMCSEALLKQVRSYQGSDLWHDLGRFKNFAHASLELCKVYMEIASSSGSQRELVTAEMHLRNAVKQAVKFSDTTEFKDMQALLEEIKERLSATSREA